MTKVLDFIWRVAGWPTGPIFGKELRVSSRRRRNYVLRFVYLALLIAFVTVVWFNVVGRPSDSVAYSVSRMSEAGKTIIATIVWFQFCALQLVAVVMMSSSISGEVYDRTLGVLVTTPIRTFQIVVGKLLSKLLQLLILLAISMPLLALVRVFGGVPWGFLVAGLCITFTACLVAGAVAMFFSILFRRAFASILFTLAAGLLFYALVPAVTAMAFTVRAIRMMSGTDDGWEKIFEYVMVVVLHGNPFGMMIMTTVELHEPSGMSGIPFFSWIVHCGVMLGFSALILLLCMPLVRRVAVRQAIGDTGRASVRPRARVAAPPRGDAAAVAGLQAGAAPLAAPAGAAAPAVPADEEGGRIRRIRGSPILWKELRTPLTRSTVKRIIGIVLPLPIIAIVYVLWAALGGLDEEYSHLAFIILYVIIGMVFTMVLSATTITSEKESRSWPLLLATTLSDGQIVLGKAAGVLRRCYPGWIPLAGHVVVFTCVGYIHPVAMAHLGMLAVGAVIFLVGTGLYFSSRFRRTTTAVVVNMGLAILIWLILPVMLMMIDLPGARRVAEVCATANPVIQAGVLTSEAAGVDNAARELSEFRYDWPCDEFGDVAGTTALMFIVTGSYIVVGVFFAACAKASFRRNIF